MKLLVIGSLNMDLVVNCDRRPIPGEMVLYAEKTAKQYGKTVVIYSF